MEFADWFGQLGELRWICSHFEILEFFLIYSVPSSTPPAYTSETYEEEDDSDDSDLFSVRTLFNVKAPPLKCSSGFRLHKRKCKRIL